MRRIAILCALVLLLAGCTSPRDEAFQEDWKASMEELEEDADSGEKDHYWKILDLTDPETVTEAGSVTDPERVRALDDLLSEDDWDRRSEDPGAPAYSYVYCQQETLKAGQDPDDREYEELLRFTVSAERDAVTMVILEDSLPSLPEVDLGDILTFSMDVPAETAEALRDPSRFLD